MLRVESGSQGEDQLHQHQGQKNSHIDNDQPGNRITGLKLIPDVIKDGTKHDTKSK